MLAAGTGRRITTIERAPGGSFYFRARVAEPFPPPYHGEPNMSAWSDGNRTFVRLVRDGRVSYHSFDDGLENAPDSKVSETTVVRPDWVATAANDTGAP